MCAAGLGIAPPLRRNPQGRRGPYALTLALSRGEREGAWVRPTLKHRAEGAKHCGLGVAPEGCCAGMPTSPPQSPSPLAERGKPKAGGEVCLRSGRPTLKHRAEGPNPAGWG